MMLSASVLAAAGGLIAVLTRPRGPARDAGAGVRPARRIPGLHPARQPPRRAGLPRPHVGTLRHVDLGGRVTWRPRSPRAATRRPTGSDRWAAFAAIGAGAAGAIAAGFFADRHGRAHVAAWP